MADDDVMGVEFDGVAGDAHAVAGGGTAVDRDVGGANADPVLQSDDARHVEHDDPGTTRVAGLAKRAGAGVVETGHDHHPPAATAKAVPARPLGAGKRRDRRLRQLIGSRHSLKERLALRRPGLDFGQRPGEGLVGAAIGRSLLCLRADPHVLGDPRILSMGHVRDRRRQQAHEQPHDLPRTTRQKSDWHAHGNSGAVVASRVAAAFVRFCQPRSSCFRS